MIAVHLCIPYFVFSNFADPDLTFFAGSGPEFFVPDPAIRNCKKKKFDPFLPITVFSQIVNFSNKN